MGITLDKLQMFTCDSNWKEEQFADRVKNKELIVYKKLQLSNFKIYWNSSESEFIYEEDESEESIIYRMNKMILK
jgi:hypothetical protein